LEGSGKGASLFVGALLGGLLPGIQKVMWKRGRAAGEFSRRGGGVYRALRRLWRRGTFLHKSHVEYLGGSVYQEL